MVAGMEIFVGILVGAWSSRRAVAALVVVGLDAGASSTCGTDELEVELRASPRSSGTPDEALTPPARGEPRAARPGAAPGDRRARRQEGADRPAARHDDRRARQGRRARARRSKPTGARPSASSRNELRRQHEGLTALSEHTQQLREALASSKVRGQWGERMAEDVLRLAGFLEGVNYRRQATLDERGGRPDYTFLMPNGLRACTWT